jgi:5'-nucleotidase
MSHDIPSLLARSVLKRATIVAFAAIFGNGPAAAATTTLLSIVGTNDLHGRLFTDDGGYGGLTVLGGFIDNLRAARAADGGAVLVLDAGDTFQGGIESNLSEGLMVVDAYNAIGYAALGVGNHDFDYGSVDPRGPLADWLPKQLLGRDPGDVRGALKAAAARARFPFLAANVLDAATGKPVAWPNVAPSALVTAAGIRVGIIGTMTESGLRQTLAAHAVGLTTSPLVPTIAREAQSLRARGAELVLLVTHAGGWCSDLHDPHDLNSCDDGAEIFRVARELPTGTLQGIVAGHTHGTVAHFVAGVPIISVRNFGVEFGRMDLAFDTEARAVTHARIHAPQLVCTRRVAATGECAAAPHGEPVEYEGRPVLPSERVAAAIAPELARVHALRAQGLGVAADTAITRAAGGESALGNLYADALRAAVPDADVALSYGSGRGGLRADLPRGPLTFGHVYDTFPFDNRVTRVKLTGAQLERVLAEQLRDGRRGLPAISGVSASVRCVADEPQVTLQRETGAAIAPHARLVVAAASYSAGSAAWAGLTPAVEAHELPLLVRDAVAAWLLGRGRVTAAELYAPDRPRWQLPSASPPCASRASVGR